MKKIIAVVCLISVLLCMLAVSAFASPKDDVMNKLDSQVPFVTDSMYHAQGVNILSQIDVSQDQANQLMALIDETTSRVHLVYRSIHMYTLDEQKYLMGVFDRACAILQLTYTVVDKADMSTPGYVEHAGDVVYYLYDKNGKLVGALDGDTVNQTGGTETDTTRNLTVVVMALAVLTAASVAYAAKKSVSENA